MTQAAVILSENEQTSSVDARGTSSAEKDENRAITTSQQSPGSACDEEDPLFEFMVGRFLSGPYSDGFR